MTLHVWAAIGPALQGHWKSWSCVCGGWPQAESGDHDNICFLFLLMPQIHRLVRVLLVNSFVKPSFNTCRQLCIHPLIWEMAYL